MGALALGALAAAAGCSTIPDRSAASAAVSAALRALPGVTQVDGQYANGMTVGQSYNVTVTIMAGADEATLARIAQTYDKQVAHADLARHTLRLTVQDPDHNLLILYGRDGTMTETTQTMQRWGRLVAAIPGPVRWRGLDDGLLEVPSDDLVATADALRRHAADLESLHWIVTEQHTRLDLMGGFPSSALARTLQRLAATGAQWTIVYNPDAQVPLTTGVWQYDDGDIEQIARGHLRVLAATGLRVDHVERLPGQPPIEVSIGGCRTDGSELQQRLNREFGSC